MSGAYEINFDGLIGPSHNYAGLSLGNVASAKNEGLVSSPRQAALQGLGKMRQLIRLGLRQGFLPPPERPAAKTLRAFGFSGTDNEVLAAAVEEEPNLMRAALSASSMWTANAATVLAAPECTDGRLHLITANLGRMLHRAFEADETFARLSAVFADTDFFKVHRALPFSQHFGDEGAANHMRLCPEHGERGINVFVYGSAKTQKFPSRQTAQASRAVARLAGLKTEETFFLTQSAKAIDAGAFHNDVVAVSNENLLFVHADAYDRQEEKLRDLRHALPSLRVHQVTDLSLEDAIFSYLFNSQIVTLPDGKMAIIVPREAEETPAARRALETLIEADTPVARAIVVDVRESMRNGGGPACLRLRVPVAAEVAGRINQSYLLNEARVDQLMATVEKTWPDRLTPADLTDPMFWEACRGAHAALTETVNGFAPLKE